MYQENMQNEVGLKQLTHDLLEALKNIHTSTMSLKGNESYLSASELCDYLKIKESKMRKMVLTKKIPHTKVGRHLRFSKEEINNWLEENSVKVD